MKYKEFIKIRNTSHTKERQAIYENLKKILDLPDDDAVSAPAESRSVSAEKAASKRLASFKNFFKKPARLAACVSMAVAVACLAIILPFTLNNRNCLLPTVPSSPTVQKERYCAAAACRQMELKYSLKEYSARHNLSLLHVDWYDVADIKTSMYVNKDNSFDIIYYQEILEHKYTGSVVELYITDLNTRVDKVDGYQKSCKKAYTSEIPYAKVYCNWGFELEKGRPIVYMAWFIYKQYVYMLVLRYPMSENDIFDLINSMLPKTRI